MERERRVDDHHLRMSDDGPSGSDNLDQQRAEVDALLRASDRVFDTINNLHAQQYLEQNLQTGGQ